MPSSKDDSRHRRAADFPSLTFLKKLGPNRWANPGMAPKQFPNWISAAMRVIPNPDLGYDDWKKFGMAIWRATAGSGEGLAALMSGPRNLGKYDADNTQKEWQRSPDRHRIASVPVRSFITPTKWTREGAISKGGRGVGANTPVEKRRQVRSARVRT